MGFHIPDSPPRRLNTSVSVSAASQTTPTTASDSVADANATVVQFSERFSSRRIVRRRNAIIPTLSIDVIGSPRSPFICLSRDSRLTLSRQHEQAQQTAFDMNFSATNDGESNRGSRGSAKSAPGIRRRSDQRDDNNTEAFYFASRASLNTRDAP